MIHPEDILHFKIVHTSYPQISGFGWVYIPFNLLEAMAWFIFGACVLCRYVRHHRTPYEWLYAVSFFLFGITDIIEVTGTTVWLLLLKASCLCGILCARKYVLTFYPDHKF